MKHLLAHFLLFITATNFAQDVPAVDWSKAGKGFVPDLEYEQINFLDFKQTFTADPTDDAVLNTILHDYPKGAIIFFPKGEYYFSKQIRLKSNFTLKGEGEESVFIFDLEKEQDCILAQGKLSEVASKLEGGVAKGSNVFPVIADEEVSAGDYIYLVDLDEELVESSWAEGKTGQIFQVWVKAAKEIKVHGYARRDYIEEWVPRIYKIEPVENVTIEKIKIVNKKETTGQTSNIHFSYVINSTIGGVTSEMANYSHVLLEFSSNCEIMGCHFNDAHDHGNGGRGYGVTLQFATGNVLVIGNHYKHLRHSMLLQAGANGNVFYHNKSSDPFWTDVRLPEDAAGDIVLHGNYVYANLIEENYVQNIVVDNSHGPNGPDNFFYGNQMSGYGLYIHRKSPGQVIINNVVVKAKWPKGRYRVKGKQFENGNMVGKKLKPKKSVKMKLKESYWY